MTAIHEDAEVLFAEAVEHQRRGRKRQAYRLYQKVLGAEPQHYESLVRCADILKDYKRYSGAVALYNRAALLRPDDFRLRTTLGHMLLRQCLFQEAIPHLTAGGLPGSPFQDTANKLRSYAMLMAGGKDIAEFVCAGETVRFTIRGNKNIGLAMHHAAGHFWEEEELGYLKEKIPPGKVIIDIGANVGNHLVYFGKFMAPKEIIPFEPHPAALEQLRENIALNNLSSVNQDYLGVGLGAKRGSFSLVENMDIVQASLITSDTGMIQVFALDEMIKGPVHFIKIDVEGMEMEVLKGARETLMRERPLIMVEVHDQHEEELTKMLHELGYVVERHFTGKGYKNCILTPHQLKV